MAFEEREETLNPFSVGRRDHGPDAGVVLPLDVRFGGDDVGDNDRFGLLDHIAHEIGDEMLDRSGVATEHDQSAGRRFPHVGRLVASFGHIDDADEMAGRSWRGLVNESSTQVRS